MASADPAKPAVSTTVRLAWGPASSVTGASSTPGSGTKVFHMTLMPCGAFIPSVVRAGSRKCAAAVASYRKYQVNWSVSKGLAATIRDAGSRHSHNVTNSAPSRQYAPAMSSTRRSPGGRTASAAPRSAAGIGGGGGAGTADTARA
jgi:hypothetical protein